MARRRRARRCPPGCRWTSTTMAASRSRWPSAPPRAPAVRAPVARHWFWSAILTQRFVYRDVLWAALLVNLFALAFPLFSMNVYDRVVPNNAIETLWALAVGVLLILGADLFMRLLR